MWDTLKKAAKALITDLFSKRFGVALSLAFAVVGALAAIVWGASQLLVKAMGTSIEQNLAFAELAKYSLDTLVVTLALSTVSLILSVTYWLVSYFLRKGKEEEHKGALASLATTILREDEKAVRAGRLPPTEAEKRLGAASQRLLPPAQDE